MNTTASQDNAQLGLNQASFWDESGKEAQSPERIQKTDPPQGSVIYTIGILESELRVLVCGSSWGSGKTSNMVVYTSTRNYPFKYPEPNGDHTHCMVHTRSPRCLETPTLGWGWCRKGHLCGPKRPHKHVDRTKQYFLQTAYVGSWNQNMRSLCLYSTIYYTLLYPTLLYSILLYSTLPYHTIPYHTIPYHAMTYYTTTYHIICHIRILVFTWSFGPSP